MASPWDELEEVNTKSKMASPWDELEEVNPSQSNGNDISNFDNILNMPSEPSLWNKAGNALQGGVKFVENKANQLADAYNNAPANGGVSIKQGLSNLGNATLEGVQNIPQGLLAFGGQLLNDTGSTTKNIIQNPASLLDAPNAFISGMYSGGRNLLQGAIDIPEAISAAYNGREFQRQYELPGIHDTAQNILQKVLVGTGIRSQEKFDESIALINQLRKQEAEKRSQLPIVSTAGEFSLPIGAMKALKIGGKTTKLATSGNTAKKASVLSDLGKAGTVGAGFGALTPGELKEKVTGAGVGTIVGSATGGVMRATPHIKNVAKFTGAAGKAVAKEAANRVNPKNYNAVIDSVPVEKGVGLSQRTVYEPKTKYEYKLNEKLDNMKRAKVVQGEKPKGTDFVMKEGSELKTPQRPQKAQRPAVKKYPAVVNTAGVSEKLRKLAPNTVAKQEAKTEEKVNTNNTVDAKGNTTYDKENGTITPIEIKQDSVPKFDNINGLKNWIIENIDLIGEVTIKSNNKKIQFSKSNISRSMKGVQRSSVKKDSYSDLKTLVENSVYGGRKNADARHSSRVKEQELYYNAFKYNGEKYGIEISIDIPIQKTTPNTYAGHKIKIIKAPTATEIGSNELTLNRLGADTISITDIKNLFNPPIKKKIYKYTKEEQKSVKMPMTKFADTYTNGEFMLKSDFVEIKGGKVQEIDNENTQRQAKALLDSSRIKEHYGAPENIQEGTLKDGRNVVKLQANGNSVIVNKKYYDLFKDLELKIGKENEPIYAVQNGEVIGTVMPIVNPSGFKEADFIPTKEKTAKTVEKQEKQKAEPKKKEVSEKAEKYEDYGEKIHGARKDIWQKYNETFEKTLPETYEEFTKTKLSDVFPDIDGMKLVENGGNSDTAAVIKLLRDSLPTKPSGRNAMMKHYREKWTNAIKEHREYTKRLLNGEMTADEAVKKLVYKENGIDFDMERKAAAYLAVGYPACKNIKGYMLDKGGVSVKDEKTGEYKKEERWYVTRENRYGLRPFKTKEEAVDYLKSVANANGTPAKKEAKLEIGKWNDERRVNGYIIYHKVGTGKYIELKNKFETSKEAREYLNEHKQELLDKLSKIKEEPPMRGEINEPRIGKGFRKGKNVNPEEFSKTFGFRGVQFGNYVEGAKRIEDVNNAYDSLMDMAEVLHIPEKAISLNGELGLAFGARGKGGKHAALAHYEPGQVVINLTKNKGAGSLAHEWWHALDNYFGKKNKGEMATETYGTRTPEFREEMAKAYSNVKSAVRKAIYSRSKELDKTRSKDYWSTDVEMTARAFETYIKHKINSQGFSNDYLANIIGEDAYKGLGREDAYPYPKKSEMPEIEKAFDEFFNTVKARETDKGVELYRPNNKDVDLPKFIKEYEGAIKNIPLKDLDLNRISREIKRGITGKKLAKLLPDNIADFVRNGGGDLIFMPTDIQYQAGSFNGSSKIVRINIEANGNNPQKFITTLIHEIQHNLQDIKYDAIVAKERKGEQLSDEDNKFIGQYSELQRVNEELSDAYNVKPELINEYLTVMDTPQEREWIANLENNDYNIVQRYLDALDNQTKAELETEAEKTGDKYGQEFTTESAIKKDSLTSGPIRFAEWLDRTISQYFNRRTSKKKSERTEFKRVEKTKKSVDNSNYADEKTIRSKIKDAVYKWHGDTNTDRYDVAKSLNSFINLSKHKAKNLSQKLGTKVTDTQLREILPFLRERTGFPKSLERDDLRKIFNRLSEQDKRNLTEFADTISDKFEKYYKNYTEAKGTPDAESIENHISHIWKLDDKKKSLLTNYITTNSKYAKKRTIGTLLEGIDGIEIDGKTVKFEPRTLDYAEILLSSTDNLIKATHDSLLANEIKNLKHNGEPLVLPAHKAPDDWVEVNHPALNKAVYMGEVGEDKLPLLMKTPVKVHPEIADYVSAIFEVQKPSKFWNTFDSLNGIVKQALLGFSGFHGYALSESSVGNVGVVKTLKELNPLKIYNQIKNGNYDVYKKEESAKRAIKAGVQLGTPSDLQRNLVEETLKKVPYLGKYIAGGVSLNNKVLWDVLHNNFKILAFETAAEKVGKDITPEQEREIAQWVNDSFGGQAWELLGIKKSTIKATSRVLLSPDWNFSTIRQAAAAINSEWADEKINNSRIGKKVSKLTGIGSENETKGVRGKIGRAFWLRSAIYFTVFYNLINAMFREKDREEYPDLYPKEMTPMDYSIWSNSYPMDSGYDKLMPKVFIGRNSDGTARMLRVGKQFREVPEFITEPVSKLGGKTSPIINTASQVGLGMGPGDAVKKLAGEEVYLNQDIWDGYGEDAKMRTGKEAAIGRAKAFGKSLVPFIASKYIGGKHELSMWDFFAQTNAGASKGKVYKQAKEAIKSGNSSKIDELKAKAYRDGLGKKEIDKMISFAQKKQKDENTRKYKSKLVDAMEKGDKKELKKITDNMKKNHLSIDEQRRIYEKAYKEYKK